MHQRKRLNIAHTSKQYSWCILSKATTGTCILNNIHSFHPAFVGEWHPETRAKVLQWLDIGSYYFISESSCSI
ncbi:hypothetical protein L208DRAFT_1508220 [Tricholoma matsutake]|nr:hypothetical protein L208DRAFT_1508220 [Tricholoma matsutake 945]